MPGTWWTRFVIVTTVLVGGFYYLLPNFLGESAQEALAAQAARADAAKSGVDYEVEVEQEELPWWTSVLPASKINLGLDLQGGIDLTLEIGVDEAILSSVQRDIKPLKQAAENDGLDFAEVRRARGEPTLLIRGTDKVGLEDVRKFMDKRYDGYDYDNTRTDDKGEVFAFTLNEEQKQYTRTRSIEQALETLRNRIDETGVKEPSIVLKGGTRINVQLPGMDNVQDAIKAIGTTAVLEFMLLDPEMDPAVVERGLVDAENAVTSGELEKEIFDDDRSLSDWMIDQGSLPETDRLMFQYDEQPDGARIRGEPIVVIDEVLLTGDDVNDARVSMDQYNQPYVALEFKPRGAKIFEDVTTENVGRRFAIVLDGQVRSAPNIRERIAGGRASIEMGSMDYSLALRDASLLSLVLRTGALPAPVTIGEVREVGASLGADSIAAGQNATFVGAAFVLVFMVVAYRKSGFVADMAIMANVFLVMALLAAAGATLTLPGIAGIALTVGMAVDCNIIVYERIREERRLGKNARAAVDAGFENALSAVLDANITTFIAGVVLFTYGTGPIKGFAVTLMIGIITTLFTGIFMSRTMMDFMTRRGGTALSI